MNEEQIDIELKKAQGIVEAANAEKKDKIEEFISPKTAEDKVKQLKILNVLTAIFIILLTIATLWYYFEMKNVNALLLECNPSDVCDPLKNMLIG